MWGPCYSSRLLAWNFSMQHFFLGNCLQCSLALFFMVPLAAFTVKAIAIKRVWCYSTNGDQSIVIVKLRNFHSARTTAALCHTGFWASRQWKCFHKSLQQDRPANTSFLSSMMRSLRSATGSLLVHANFFAEIFGPTIPLFLGKYPHFLLSGFILRCPFWSLSGLTIPRDHPSKSLVDRKLLNSHTRPFALML